ncbi:class I SAM-dependent methyltransferase [Amycolatopsis sp. A133]|uniref:class I SAM-dependent methyltransferase n=1 Tax=Amycolatopsis sp. A133 TaxID=3064472 RepID=UPI0027E733AC|nr:class I SAM-dependent methyltransferase [Amycolatopsis sp. A133]MDQ7803497.1 class I SAM-dependent methyltransferase [Amycolatopsis sp. A133]
MIGRQNLPEEYLTWNKVWSAPFGTHAVRELSMRERLAHPDPASLGMFAFQHPSLTRRFEYPWAFHTAAPAPGMRVVEIGGGLAGFQFVLADAGCEVTTVDPAAAEGPDQWSGSTYQVSWALTPESHQKLNTVFGTGVRLLAERLQDCALPDGTFDRIFCLSVLEHVPPAEARGMLERSAALLKPGGLLILTVDLFLDVIPFGVLKSNSWGTNLDVHELVTGLGLDLVAGDPRELLGFPEFDFDRVVRLIPELMMGTYPVLSQALALRKPA